MGALSALRNNLDANFNRFIGDSDRATLLSAVSFISRIGMLANLIILKYTVNSIPINWTYFSSIVGITAVAALIVRWNRRLILQEIRNEI